MKLTVPAPTAGIRHRDGHAADILDQADNRLAAIDGLIGPPPPDCGECGKPAEWERWHPEREDRRPLCWHHGTLDAQDDTLRKAGWIVHLHGT